MQLTTATQRALDGWVVTTWHTNHSADQGRFYEFVSQYQKDHGYHIDEAELEEAIKGAAVAKGLTFGAHHEKRAEEYASLAVDILDFLRVTKR